MDIDIQLYVKRLQDFFNNDKNARKDMFGNAQIDMPQFYGLVAQQATLNNNQIGDPTLSPIQLMAIMTELAAKEIVEELDIHQPLHLHNYNMDKIFYTPIDGFPPFCLN